MGVSKFSKEKHMYIFVNITEALCKLIGMASLLQRPRIYICEFISKMRGRTETRFYCTLLLL